MTRAVKISDAKALTEATGSRGTIVISFDGRGGFSVTSYGETRRECAALAKVTDQLGDLFKCGNIRVPAELGG